MQTDHRMIPKQHRVVLVSDYNFPNIDWDLHGAKEFEGADKSPEQCLHYFPLSHPSVPF